ncbi:hypothetical protein PENSOL_c056G09940 [Penicillium solitum]|uniref:Protein kinase domain-containing protein n=1 Tax=Penicillium solitum TaxID=60172 RepID=A0A1V6QQI5_9EURO|nr:uncharacterized protein PENSOL_c056G09940 [Penicillium solitum]OQD91257.1 hypothetical protein PENSOL_c056G09940 [Penicillium solitum]
MTIAFKKALSRVNSQSWLAKYFGPVSQTSRSPTQQQTTEEPDFYVDGSLLRISDLAPTSLERLINGSERPFLKPNDMPDAEIPIFIDFLQGMLTIDPAHRKSAAELLRHEWLEL